jgi:NitT/TauT family transport system substrate-binding protein
MIIYRTRRLATRPVLASAALAVAVLSAAVGCGSGSQSPSATGTGPEQPDITIAAIKSVTATGLYIAQQRGYFAAEGLHVTVESTVSSEAAIPDLVAGRLQVVFGNYVSDILAQASGVAKLRFLAAGNVSGPREQEVVVLPGSPITSPAQLRGKVIGVNAFNNIGTLMIGSVLAQYGVPASAVHFVQIPFPDMGAALAAHRIDAGYMSDPFLASARQKYHVRTVFDCDQGAVANIPISGYAVTSAWAVRNPRTAAAFVRALEKGQALAGTDRAAVNSVLAAYIGIPEKTAAQAAIGTFPVGQTVQSAPLQRLADLMLRAGLLKNPVNVATMTSGG